MDQLRIVDYQEWWITHEDRLRPEEHGVYVKYTTATGAYTSLKFAREHYPHRIFECQEIVIHRTATKLDW